MCNILLFLMKMHLRSEQKKYTRQSTLRHTEIVAYVSIGRGWFCVVPGHSGKNPLLTLGKASKKIIFYIFLFNKVNKISSYFWIFYFRSLRNKYWLEKSPSGKFPAFPSFFLNLPLLWPLTSHRCGVFYMWLWLLVLVCGVSYSHYYSVVN